MCEVNLAVQLRCRRYAVCSRSHSIATGLISMLYFRRQKDAHLHSAVIPVSDTQIQPFPSFHLRARCTRAFLLERGYKWMGEVLCKSSTALSASVCHSRCRYSTDAPELLVDPACLVHRDFWLLAFLRTAVVLPTFLLVLRRRPGQRHNPVHVVHVEPDEQRNVLLQLKCAV